MVDKRDLVSVFDYEAAARGKLPQTAYDYYRSGANDEITLHENHAAFERIQLYPRVLIDISKHADFSSTHGLPPHGPSGRGGGDCQGRRSGRNDNDIQHPFK